MEAITDADPKVAQRAFAAMMTMGKIDIAAIEAARNETADSSVIAKRN